MLEILIDGNQIYNNMIIRSIGDLEEVRRQLLDAFGEEVESIVIEMRKEDFNSIRKYLPNIPSNIVINKFKYKGLQVKLK